VSSTAEQILWVFDGRAGDFITIDTVGANAFFDPTLILHDPRGVLVAQNDYSGEGYLGNDAHIPFTFLPESGQYVIRAGGGVSAEPYTWTLKTIEQIVQEYTDILGVDPDYSFESAQEAHESCKYGTFHD